MARACKDKNLFHYPVYMYSQHRLIRLKHTRKFSVELGWGVKFRIAFNIGSQWNVSREKIELSGLVELPVVS